VATGRGSQQVTTAAVPARGKLLTPAEVANIMRVSTMTVYRLVKSNDLPAVRVGKAYRIHEHDLNAYLEQHYTQAG
jgi:excisionase family DNA binding protein